MSAPTLPTLGPPVVIDPAGVSTAVVAKANRLANAGMLSREHHTDTTAVYLVGGDTGTYYVRLQLGADGWVGECEHPARMAERGRPIFGKAVCSHVLLAAQVEAAGRHLTIPTLPAKSYTPPTSYDEFRAAWDRHMRREDQPGDTQIIREWQQWRARQGQEARQ